MYFMEKVENRCAVHHFKRNLFFGSWQRCISSNPYIWPKKWVTGVITPINGVITLLTTGKGRPCGSSKVLEIRWFRSIFPSSSSDFLGSCSYKYCQTKKESKSKTPSLWSEWYLINQNTSQLWGFLAKCIWLDGDEITLKKKGSQVPLL